MPKLTIDERLDVLLHVKWTVKEFDCNLTREIVDLIDREADLLNRCALRACVPRVATYHALKRTARRATPQTGAHVGCAAPNVQPTPIHPYAREPSAVCTVVGQRRVSRGYGGVS
jgi:hypothetical protein